MVKKKQDLIKMAKLCGIPALGRVEDLKISLIQFIEGLSTFKTYSNFKIEIIDELTKHLNRAAIEEELSQLGVAPKGTLKEIRTLLAQTIEAKYIPNEGHTPRVLQSEPGSTIRDNIDAAAEFLVDKANTDTRYIIRNAEIRPPTDKEVEKKIQILESSILKLQEECSAQKKIIQQLVKEKLVHKETPVPVNELGNVEPDNMHLPHKPDHSTAEDINMKDALAEVLHKLNHHNNVLKVHSDRMDLLEDKIDEVKDACICENQQLKLLQAISKAEHNYCAQPQQSIPNEDAELFMDIMAFPTIHHDDDIPCGNTITINAR